MNGHQRKLMKQIKNKLEINENHSDLSTFLKRRIERNFYHCGPSANNPRDNSRKFLGILYWQLQNVRRSNGNRWKPMQTNEDQ